MPANIRVRCKYVDCKFLNGIFCGNADIEVNPKDVCLAYVPVIVEELPEDEDDFDGDEAEDEAEWTELEDDESEDDLEDSYGSEEA
jgi:hypothetical protein